MLKLTMTAMIQIFLVLGCTSLTQNGDAKNAQASQPAVASKPGQTSPSNEGRRDCVRSINEFGKSRQCRCPDSLVYNPITGNCEKGGRMCTMSLTDMFNEKTGQCYTARNGCEASDLESVGWRKKLETDTCKAEPN